jgi:serine/threonine-protein kinase SRPK3
LKAPKTPDPLFRDPINASEDRFALLRDVVEWPEAYYPGGLHLINLGDALDYGRYKILRKLGFGRRSTVWLAEDNK